MSNKAQKRGLVPKLRFPAFQAAGEWEEKKLGEFATFSKGKGLPKSVITPNGKSPCIHYGELFTEHSEVIRAVKSYTDLDENIFLSVENDVLMPTSDVSPRGLAKACCIKLNDVILGGDVLVIRTSKESINGEFLARHIRHLEQKVLQLVSGTTVFHLYATSIDKLVLSIPQKQEQQTIADCFASLDERITLEAQKLDTLKTHKKGLMQQLFPAEGETLPKLRFPEFRDAGEWELKELGTLCEIYTGKKDANEGSPDGQYPFFTCADQHSYSHTYSFDAEAILIAGNANVGQTKYYKGKFEAYQRTYVLTDFREINVTYLYTVLSAKLQASLLAQVQTSAMSYIRLPMLEEYKLALPPHRSEQQKIADCLASLDDLITAQTQKLAALKTHKKGLMQQLFPSVGGVAGEA